MKKLLFTVLSVLFWMNMHAQDLILLKSAEEINGKVEQIRQSELLYRKAELPDGPLYTIPLKDVFSVTYANGYRETFNDFAAEIQEVSNGEGYPYPPVSRAYKVGEIFNEGGVKGIVIHTTDNGRHGLLLSMTESSTPIQWGSLISNGDKVVIFKTDARDKSDGWNNMKTIEGIIDNTDVTWNNFPAFQFCREQGPGWYLPSIDELNLVWNLASGSPQSVWDQTKSCKRVQECLENHGADGMFYAAPFYIRNYHSSTECDAFTVWPLLPINDKYYPKVYSGKTRTSASISNKNNMQGSLASHVRAVHKF